jgi:hypothetical protein
MKVFYKSIFFIRSCENCLKFDKDTIKEFKTIYNNIKSIQKQPHTDLEDHQDLYNKYSMTLKEPVTHDDMTAIIATLTKLLIEKTKDEYLFMRCNRQSAAAVGARFWSGQERGWQRRTSTHSEHGKAGAVDSDQLWATGTGSWSGKARAFGERRNGMEPCGARAVQRRTTSASENAGTTRQGQQGPERGSGRPAGHAAALQIDGSHRLQS